MAGTWSTRLAELGITLPPVVAPVGSYTPALRVGDLVYTSGQLPVVELVDPVPLQVQVRAHPERLERILGHVVQNALDATNDDGKVSAQLLLLDGAKVRIVVTDTGCGMSPEFLRDRLSRPFQTPKRSGMGFGVFETRQYLNEIGGELQFDSQVGQGTRVTIELPRLMGGRSEIDDGASEIHV